MKSPKYKSVSRQDVPFKIDDFSNGYRGFVQPGSGYDVVDLEWENETKLCFNNTGSTVLKFRLVANESFDHQINNLTLQPGELFTLEVDKITTLSCNILHVTNLHPEMEGSFVVLVLDNKKKNLRIDTVIS